MSIVKGRVKFFLSQLRLRTKRACITILLSRKSIPVMAPYSFTTTGNGSCWSILYLNGSQSELSHIMRHLRSWKKIKDKKEGILTSGVSFYYENLRSHTAWITQNPLNSLDEMIYPSYSPETQDRRIITF